MNIIVIGTGKVALGCIKILHEKNINMFYIEPEPQFLSITKNYCIKNKIEYKEIYEKNNLNTYFRNLNDETVIISAHNKFIFPGDVIEKTNLRIINYHNSLLPKYRGLNPPAWALFNMETNTGVTWHRVSAEIDKGEIISQTSFTISDFDTAFSLTEKCAEIGIEMFENMADDLINGKIKPENQILNDIKDYHNLKEIPNQGILNPEWDIKKISAFLRAMDYGKFKIFPEPYIIIGGEIYYIVNYEIIKIDVNNTRKVYVDIPVILIIENNLKIKLNLKKQANEHK